MRAAALFGAALVAASAATGQVDDDGLDTFRRAMKEIQERYVDEARVSNEILMTKAEEGVLDSLDPESLVLSDDGKPGEAEAGVTIGVKDSSAWVLDVAENGPADAAGLKPGDRLLRVGGDDTYNKKRPEIDRALRGPAGTTVWLLWVIASGEFREAAVKLAVLNRPAFRRLKLDGTDIIQVYRLDMAAVRGMKDAMKPDADGVVLDLRRAAGGDVDAALELADSCFAGGELLATGHAADPMTARQYIASKKGNPLKMPLVLLTGGGTAGAAELLAAALKEHGRAVLVGKRTFGFAARQKEFPLGVSGKKRIRLTVERFLSPLSVNLSSTGVESDIEAEAWGTVERSALLDRHRVPERLADRLIEDPPASFDAQALKGGELKLSSLVAKGKSVSEQRWEFERSFAVALAALVQEMELDVKPGQLEAERPALISRVRVLLARRRMTPEAAALVALREDREVALGVDMLKAMRTLKHSPASEARRQPKPSAVLAPAAR